MCPVSRAELQNMQFAKLKSIFCVFVTVYLQYNNIIKKSRKFCKCGLRNEHQNLEFLMFVTWMAFLLNIEDFGWSSPIYFEVTFQVNILNEMWSPIKIKRKNIFKLLPNSNHELLKLSSWSWMYKEQSNYLQKKNEYSN